MKNIIFCGYRKWAYSILEHAIEHANARGDVCISDVIYTGEMPHGNFSTAEIKFHYFDGKNNELYEKVIKRSKAEIVIFSGWSWLIPKEITENTCCICLHPSDLPSFAGGSPIQNQVFAGVSNSMLTIFRMDEGIGTGPIYKKTAISLLGPIEEVFDKIALAALPLVRDLISDFANDDLIYISQANNLNQQATIRRRSSKDSIFLVSQINNMTCSEFQKAVDVLRYPYPNLRIEVGAEYVEVRKIIELKSKPVNSVELNYDSIISTITNRSLYVSLSNGFAVLLDYSVIKEK